MADAGIGAFDSSQGNYGFKATADGKVSLGNTSDDVIQVTGSFEIKNDTNPHVRLVHTDPAHYADLKSDNEGNLILGPSADKLYIQRAGTTVVEFFNKATNVYITSKQQDVDLNFGVNDGGSEVTVFNLDAANSMANITKFLSYQAVTYDLGSGMTSTITPTSSLHLLTATNVTGDAGSTHIVSLSNGASSGQVLQLILTTTTNNMNLLFNDSNLLGGWSFVGMPANSQGATMTFIWTGSAWSIMNTNSLASAS